MIHTAMLSPIMVGRGQELDALDARLAAAAEGRGATALIGGDAGIGKSRLCRELRARAVGREMRVIEGRCSPAEAGVPYGPFLDALRFQLSRGESEEVSEALDPILPHVAPLFEELSTAAPGAQSREPAVGSRPFGRILRVLRRFASAGPVLVLLEDIHWADPTSRDLLHYLARRIGGDRLLLVATYRTDELHAGHPVHRLVSAMARERLAQRIQLEPLDGADLRDMLAAVLGTEPKPEFVDAVRARTDGNPLFIEELLAVLVNERPDRNPHYDAADLADASPPPTIHDIVLGRVEPLGDDAMEALTVASVIGRRFRFEVLQSALEWSEQRLLGVIEALVAHRVLVEEPGGEDRFAFRHSLVHEVLYGGTIGRRRRQWHRQVASALERHGGESALPHTTLAHHYRLGGELSRAREHAVFAGDEAARLCAWSQAEAMYERALEASEQEPPNPALQAELLEKMADVAWWQDRFGPVEQYAEEALALRRKLGDARHVAALLRRLAALYAYQKGDVDRAIATLRDALHTQEAAGESTGLALVVNDLGRLHLARGELDAAERSLERGLALAAEHGDEGEEAFSLAYLGRLAVRRGDIGAGRARLDVARALLREAPLPVARTAEVYSAAIRALESAREHRAARDWVEVALAYAAEHELEADAAIYEAYRAAIDRRAGRWGNALAIARAAADRLRAAGRAELREALRIMGDLHRVRGDAVAAAGAYEEALALGDDDSEIGLALLLLADGRPADAADRLATNLDTHPAGERLHALRTLPILVEAAAAAGRTSVAEQAFERLDVLVAACDYRPGPAVRAHADGVVRAAAGDSEAAGAFEDAAARWDALELPYEAARARLARAVALLRAGDRDVAPGLARDAVAALDELGAEADVRRAAALLGEFGIDSRSAPSPPPVPEPISSLTSREREVLAELALGDTNKQIARTLSITSKTVGNHVSSILAKLGCSNRTEASRIALAAQFRHSEPAPASAGRRAANA